MTRIAEYPDEITDVRAWQAEVGLVAYRDGKLTVPQLAELLRVSEMDAYRLIIKHELPFDEDDFMLAQELAGLEAFRKARAITAARQA